MEGAPRKVVPPDLRDLGLRRTALALWLFGSLVAPFLTVLAVGAAWPVAVAAGAAGLALAGAGIAAGVRRLRTSLFVPLEQLTASIEQMRSSGKASRVLEHGAPVLRPMLRRFNLASIAVEQRDQQSRASVVSVEAAFDRVHAVLQSLREGVVVVDAGGRVVLANRSARKLWRSEERVEGRPLLDLVDGDLRETLQQSLARIDGGQATEIRTADVAYAGRIFDVDCVQVQSNQPGQNYGRVIVLADVTRNHEISKLKDDLLSSISHELRTPLTSMCSSSEILASLTAADEAEWREFANILNLESHRLKMLVDDVMEYSQLETRRSEWHFERGDAAALLRDAAGMLRAAAAAKDIELTCAAAAAAPVVVDRKCVTEALSRILDNALKFTPRGGKVHAALTVHGDLAEIAIDDSGPGIAPADRLRVFERFSQVGDVMTAKPPGTGLGLAITQRIVDAMGGTIWCEESPLGGARFRLVLPLAAAKPGGAPDLISSPRTGEPAA